MTSGPHSQYPQRPLVVVPQMPDIAHQLTDVFSNPVLSFTETWNLIQTVKHPEMAGYENIVYETIERPDQVMESLLHDAAAIFETVGTGPYGRNVRVVVNYDSSAFSRGGIRGKLTTAYDRDVLRFPTPNVGDVIWSKQKGKVK